MSTTPGAPAPAAPAAPASSGSAPPTPTAPAGGAPPAQGGTAPAPSRHTWKDKVDGKEVEFAATDDELRGAFRHRQAADRRFEEAARLRREASEQQQKIEQRLKSLTSDPKSLLAVLREQGVEDPLDYMAELLQQQLNDEEQLNNPVERERRRLAEENERLTRAEQERKQQEEQTVIQRQVAQELERIAGVFMEAGKKLDLPMDDDTLAIMAELEQQNRHRGLDLSADQLAGMVKERVVTRGLKSFLGLAPELAQPGDLPIESAQRLLKANPELTSAFKRALRAELKHRKGIPAAPPPTPASQPDANKPPSQPRLMSDAEEWEKLAPGVRVLRGA